MQRSLKLVTSPIMAQLWHMIFTPSRRMKSFNGPLAAFRKKYIKFLPTIVLGVLNSLIVDGRLRLTCIRRISVVRISY